MITLLEYAAEKIFGPPTYRRGGGESYWPCVKCGSDKWHTRPSVTGKRDRFSCWSCQWWGDIQDLLVLEEPNYSDRLELLERLHAEFAALPIEQTPSVSAAPSFTPGSGSTAPTRDEEIQIDQAWAELTADESQTLATAFDIAVRVGAPIEVLAIYCRSFKEFIRQSDERHRQQEEEEKRIAKFIRPVRRDPRRNGKK